MEKNIFLDTKDIAIIDARIQFLKDNRDDLEYAIFNLHRDIEMICEEVEYLVELKDILTHEAGDLTWCSKI